MNKTANAVEKASYTLKNKGLLSVFKNIGVRKGNSTINQQKGITLVALVITIIIMLILAGISIQVITNTGLFTQAKNAKKETKRAQVTEWLNLKLIEEQANNPTETAEKVIEATRAELYNNVELKKLGKNVVVDENTSTIEDGEQVDVYFYVQVDEDVYKVEMIGAKFIRETEVIDNMVDEIDPKANIELSATSIEVTDSIIATVTHIDNESGVDIEKCKWIYNTTSSEIGTDVSSYTGTFSSNPESITLKAKTAGTYYLHILTTDVSGRTKETISNPVTIEVKDLTLNFSTDKWQTTYCEKNAGITYTGTNLTLTGNASYTNRTIQTVDKINMSLYKTLTFTITKSAKGTWGYSAWVEIGGNKIWEYEGALNNYKVTIDVSSYTDEEYISIKGSINGTITPFLFSTQ